MPYFLKQLKRAGLATHHLFDFYIAVVRPVLEYCAPVWHYALTKAQTQELEAIEKRAIHINFTSHVELSPWLLAEPWRQEGINSKVDVCEKAKHHTELFW